MRLMLALLTLSASTLQGNDILLVNIFRAFRVVLGETTTM